MTDFKGRTILVTGASGGIGAGVERNACESDGGPASGMSVSRQFKRGKSKSNFQNTIPMTEAKADISSVGYLLVPR